MPEEASLKEVMEYFEIKPTQFQKEWKELSNEEKSFFKVQIGKNK